MPAAQQAANMLRIPTELQSHAAMGAMGMANAAMAADARGIVSSPLPFESSLAPDFLALFANSTFDND